MPRVDLPGCTLYFAHIKGAGSPYPPLVLVHGAGGSHLDWPPHLRRLRNMRVIALDLPGHGKSTGPARINTRAYADDVCALLNALNIERAIIAGHSMGGGIAQQIGLHRPERAAGLILLGTGSKLPVEPTLTQRITEDTTAAIDWVINRAWSAHVPNDMKDLARQRLLATPPEVLRDDFRACQSFDVREQLAQITAPTLVIGARNDRMIKLNFSVTLAEHIPNATLAVIEDSGHMFPLEKAEKVAQIISTWLSEQL